jgi:hypothetical protein
MLNSVLFARRPDVELRVYGHYGEACDLNFLKGMTNVTKIAADSLMQAVNFEALGEVPRLKSLSIGIFNLESFDFLNRVPRDLSELALGATRSAKPDLSGLHRFQDLKKIFVEGHSRTISVLGSLPDLEDVTLRSITTPDLDWLSHLTKMWSLDIKLGGTRKLDAISGMSGIKYLELWQVRGLADISVISHLPGLQNLFLQSLPQVTEIPDLRANRVLRRIMLENMKGLINLGNLEFAPALQEFLYVDARGKNPEQLVPVLRNPNTRRVLAGFGSKKKNDQFARLRDEYGKDKYQGATFIYQ